MNRRLSVGLPWLYVSTRLPRKDKVCHLTPYNFVELLFGQLFQQLFRSKPPLISTLAVQKMNCDPFKLASASSSLIPVWVLATSDFI